MRAVAVSFDSHPATMPSSSSGYGLRCAGDEEQIAPRAWFTVRGLNEVNAMPSSVHLLNVDHSEGRSALLDTVRKTGAFEVRMGHLATGDYLIDDEGLI